MSRTKKGRKGTYPKSGEGTSYGEDRVTVVLREYISQM